MSVPKRIKKYSGRYALVDGVPFTMPVRSTDCPAFMAAFFCDYEKAKNLLPGDQLHPFKFINGKAVFVVTVINYVDTTIGKYIEYSLALVCTRGAKPAPAMLPLMFMKWYNLGQFILDLPVSSDISVKGGKGIWGMPKHKANLDFKVTEKMVSAQYEKDGQFAFRIEIEKPLKCNFPVNTSGINFSHFRNMLMESYVYFKAKAGIRLGKSAKGTLYIGDHPRVKFLHDLDIQSKPFMTIYMPATNGILDDHIQCWYMTYENKPEKVTPEGFESVINLELNQDWLPPPSITDYEKFKI